MPDQHDMDRRIDRGRRSVVGDLEVDDFVLKPGNPWDVSFNAVLVSYLGQGDIPFSKA